MASTAVMEKEDEAENFYMIRRFSEIVRGSTRKDEPLGVSFVAKVDLDVERDKKGKFYVEEAFTGIFGEAGEDPN